VWETMPGRMAWHDDAMRLGLDKLAVLPRVVGTSLYSVVCIYIRQRRSRYMGDKTKLAMKSPAGPGRCAL